MGKDRCCFYLLQREYEEFHAGEREIEGVIQEDGNNPWIDLCTCGHEGRG
jgi:hypothetical protein